MKLNFSSLPFVMSSQIVSRNQPNQQLEKQLSNQQRISPKESIKPKISPLFNKELFDNDKGGAGSRAGFPLDGFAVNVKRTSSNDKRKLSIRSSLEELPSPTKLKKRKVHKSSLVRYGIFNQPIIKKKKKHTNNVIDHVVMVKQKKSIISEPTIVNSCSGPQEVPVYPMMPTSFNDSYYDNETGKNKTWKSNKPPLSVRFSDDNHVINETEGDNSSILSVEDNNGGSSSPYQTVEEEYTNTRPPAIHHHYYTSQSTPEPFNPQTLGIKMLFPREE